MRNSRCHACAFDTADDGDDSEVSKKTWSLCRSELTTTQTQKIELQSCTISFERQSVQASIDSVKQLMDTNKRGYKQQRPVQSKPPEIVVEIDI